LTARLTYTAFCLLLLQVMTVGLGVSAARAQGVDPAGRPIAAIRVTGVEEVDPQLVLNQVRTEVGQPYDPQRVARDIQNISRLGRFSAVRADVAQNEQGGIILTFVVQEQPLLADVGFAGNKQFGDAELRQQVLLRPGDPADTFLIQRGVDQIERMYRDAGHFLVDVSIDEQALAEDDVLIYQVREGPQVRVRDLAFAGNDSFTAKQLRSEIATQERLFLLRKGELSEQQLEQDVARLREFYQQRGHLDVRVGRRIELSPDQQSAIVVFEIDEGRQYRVGDIRFEIDANQDHPQFSDAALREALALKAGDVFGREKLRDSVTAIKNLYGKLGYLSTDSGGRTEVSIDRVFREEGDRVDLIVRIREGRKYAVGDIIIRGNRNTQDRVVRRELRGLQPGRTYDRAGLAESQQRIRESQLFNEAKITVLGSEDAVVRDLLVEVEEARTGSASFGASVSSDAGLLGAIDFQQRNFDIADVPESWGELVSGRAFRGAGQTFSISLQPGDEFSRYSVAWSDPHLLDSSYFVSSRFQFFTRDRNDYDEQRAGAFMNFGKRFGDVWSASVRGRAEQIEIDDIESDAPTDVFDVEGDSSLAGLGFNITRSTVDSRIFPTRGTRLVAGVERTAGDFDFTRLTAEGNAFFTVDEDFFGRKTVVSLRTELGYILEDNEAPIFERFFAGGQRSFRGFEFRGVGPRGIDPGGNVTDESIGGRWLMLLGAEYNFPVFQDTVRMVFFVDSGTLQEEVGVDKWRLAAGTGLRLQLPFLGQAPFAFDLAVPILEEEEDETRVFSFSVALPF